MAEEFAFNAPTFYDFNLPAENVEQEKSDSFFETDHDNLYDVKYEDISSCEIENIDEQRDEIVPIENIEEQRDEANESIFYSPVGTITVNGENCKSAKKSVRRSKSVEVKKTTLNKSEVGNSLCKKMSTLTINKKSNMKYASSENLRKSNLTKSNLQNTSLPRTISQDHLNKLAQPKYKFSSMENLRKNEFVSVAQAVSNFCKGTPLRFKRSGASSKSNLPVCSKKTIPQSPALRTKSRKRETNIVSTEQKEFEEFEKEQKFKIRARPINKNILGPVKAVASALGKPVITIPQPFKLTAMPPKKVQPSPKKPVPVFHAKPAPKSLYQSPKFPDQKHVVTEPETPGFVRRYNSLKNLLELENEQQKKEEKPKLIHHPRTDNFEKKHKEVLQKKEQYINEILEKEKKAREFHAKPLPKKIYSPCKKTATLKTKSNENINHIETQQPCFKARPPLVLYKKPFIPKKEETQIVVEEFKLSTNTRAKEREEYDNKIKKTQELSEAAKQENEERQRQLEEEERAKFRKQTEYKAQPIKKYKPVVIQPSYMVTEPQTPSFMKNRHVSANKENVFNNI